ncbi:hypothetical protein BDY21DRAFT_199973 [Lineolata rhizophorae]|uniref:Uncharacterized protein n=1 Tax=Lineolata rhizophorae TaxID=578093 RepID=A0A6A6P5H3_9PEZI|nr:hypothetical protein BDY21DRAFT_199973 [Lineolata rhizophorae]
MQVNPGGGVRRNPKRKNAGAYSTAANDSAPSVVEIDRAFEHHLKVMAQGGTWGDNMELTAFSAAYKKEIQVFQGSVNYVIDAGNCDGRVYIAYHTWEHYSSIRNLDGPHTGLPSVQVKVLSPDEEQRKTEKLAKPVEVQPWMVEVVIKSLPFLADKKVVLRALEQSHGNIDNAVSKLLEADDRGSASTHESSSSVEREPDSDDEALNGPNKKRDRNLSRANLTRTVSPRTNKPRRRLYQRRSPLSRTSSQGSQEASSRGSSASPAMSGIFQLPGAQGIDDGFQLSRATSFDELGRDLQKAGSTIAPSPSPAPSSVTGSEAPAPAKGLAPPGMGRVKLNPPKAPDSDAGEPADSTAGKRTQQRQPGPQRRRAGPTARERKDQKKAAQKAARKERAVAEAKDKTATDGVADKGDAQKLPIMTKGKTFAPSLASDVKTLYV